jgi:nucleoside-diphosphate-sugar epimerase
MRALVIGGTGPTGPGVVRGLLERGYEVAIYHRGTHETDALPQVHQHLHGNPDNLDALTADFGDSSWNLVVSMYGRLRLIADVMAGRCDRFIAIGGKGGNVPAAQLPFPQGRGFPRDETHPRFEDREQRIGWAVAQTERDVFAHHEAGDFRATMLRYTDLYGPRVPRQWLWPLVRRVLDGRSHVIVPGDGSQLRTSCYIENAAQQVLTLVDREESAGRAFHAVDAKAYSLLDVIRLVAEELGHPLQPVPIAHPLAGRFAVSYAAPSDQFDTAGLRALGYRDLVDPADGIRATVRWLADHRDELDEDQLDALVPNPYAYDLEDRLIESYGTWSEQISSEVPAPEQGRALGPGFRAGYSPPAG